MALIIHAPNVHQGGGETILLPLLKACSGMLPGTFILDERLPFLSSLGEGSAVVYKIKARLKARLNAEWRLRQITKPGDIVLCMGNLPPLFRLPSHVFVFLQNRYLVERSPIPSAFPRRVRVRLRLERRWFELRTSNADTFIVQTESMRESLKHIPNVHVLVMPLFPGDGLLSRRWSSQGSRAGDFFIYVASGDPHKNHRNLLEAWVLLAKEGLRPALFLTVDKRQYPGLADWIERLAAAFELRVSNFGKLSREELLRLYQDSNALIFPSTKESFGLPLIEARQAGLPILASELDFVRDLVDPEESFDPASPRSIARAVKRFLGRSDPDVALIDASAFLHALFEQVSASCTS